MASRRRRSCKYGKLKRKTKGRRCRKARRSRSRRRRRKSRKSACKARFPKSLSSLMSKVLMLGRERLSLAKRMAKAREVVNRESDQVKKLEKQLVLQQLGDERNKVLDKFNKTKAKLDQKLAEFASKGAVNVAIAAIEKRKFDAKYDKMMGS